MTDQINIWAINQQGDFEQQQVPSPELCAGHVLVKVVATSFNPIDSKIKAGLAPIMTESKVLGCDIAGEVVAVADDVTAFSKGDKVFGCACGVSGNLNGTANSGAMADVVAVDAQLIAHAPVNIPLQQCAAYPLVAITAWDVLRRMRIEANDMLFISGASGGVGHMAVQLASQLGVLVYGSAGNAERAQQVENLGAEKVWPRDSELDIKEEIKQQAAFNGFDFVLDTFGGDSFQQCLDFASPYAQVATTNGRNTYDLTFAHTKSLTIHAIFMLLPLLNGVGRRAHGDFLQELAVMIEAGKVSVNIQQELSFDQADQAYQLYGDGKMTGKLVLVHPDFLTS